MPYCLVLGDSLAVGTAQHLPQCEVHARVGATTNSLLGAGHQVFRYNANTVMISTGSNDSGPAYIQYDVIRKLRKSVTADRVFWILPNSNAVAREAIKEVAKEHGDFLIDARNYDRSPDRVHPTAKGYKEIANSFPVLK